MGGAHRRPAGGKISRACRSHADSAGILFALLRDDPYDNPNLTLTLTDWSLPR